jgi:hypothetical protein
MRKLITQFMRLQFAYHARGYWKAADVGSQEWLKTHATFRDRLSKAESKVF